MSISLARTNHPELLRNILQTTYLGGYRDFPNEFLTQNNRLVNLYKGQ